MHSCISLTSLEAISWFRENSPHTYLPSFVFVPFCHSPILSVVVRFLPIFPLARLIQLFWGSRGGTKYKGGWKCRRCHVLYPWKRIYPVLCWLFNFIFQSARWPERSTASTLETKTLNLTLSWSSRRIPLSIGSSVAGSGGAAVTNCILYFPSSCVKGRLSPTLSPPVARHEVQGCWSMKEGGHIKSYFENNLFLPTLSLLCQTFRLD